MKIELRKCDENLILSLPPNFVSQLDWQPGDICECVTEAGGIRIVRTETAYDRAMKIAREAMDEYHKVFETLAKT